jgi:hypothetical protein
MSSRGRGTSSIPATGSGIPAVARSAKVYRPRQPSDDLNLNLDRVRNLVKLYCAPGVGTGSGRKLEKASDILRSAVVLLHASLEEFLRGIFELRAANANADLLRRIGFYGRNSDERKQSIELQFMAAFRGTNVDQFIEEMIQRHMDEKQSFSQWERTVSMLQGIGLSLTSNEVGRLRKPISALMQRRHLIVHQADLSRTRGRGQQRTTSLGKLRVSAWIKAVSDLADAISDKL